MSPEQAAAAAMVAEGKTVISDAAGEVRIDVPRDREGTFEPQIVKKRQRRLTEVDEIVLSLYAKGMTTGEISAHFSEIYGASVSKETISRITDKVVAEMNDWSTRPLDSVYVAVFIDAIVVKVREGQVANRPVYAAIGVTVDGCKDVLGLWAGSGGEGAKFWMSVLIDLKNRGVRDVFFVVCDGLKGLPDTVEAVWPEAIVQTCIIHLIRNTFRLTSRADADAIKRDIKPIYTAVNADAALAALDELDEKWRSKYRAMIRLWRNAWNEFIPFLAFDVEIRKVVCSTDEIVKGSRLSWQDGEAASAPRRLGMRVRPARLPRSRQRVVACRCRPRLGCGSSRAARALRLRVRVYVACARSDPGGRMRSPGPW
jgi:transposase-like protein